MEDLNKKPLVEIVQEMTYLEQEIELKMLRYEKLRKEIIKRFPQTKDMEEFKIKKLKK